MSFGRILRSFGNSLNKMKPFISVLIIILFLFNCNDFNSRKEERLKKLQQINSEVPVYNDFEQIDSSRIIKNDSAVISYFYKSAASYEEVEKFYSAKLIEKDWIFLKEEAFGSTGRKRLMFNKGEYQIAVEYGKPSNSNFDYALSLTWQTP